MDSEKEQVVSDNIEHDPKKEIVVVDDNSYLFKNAMQIKQRNLLRPEDLIVIDEKKNLVALPDSPNVAIPRERLVYHLRPNVQNENILQAEDGTIYAKDKNGTLRRLNEKKDKKKWRKINK